LKEIHKENRECAHRLFQCVAAASRPLRVEELAEFLAFDFEAGSIPTFLPDWRSEDPTHTVLSTCSSLLAVVDDGHGFQVIQFAHFSVKEYLTSKRLAETKDTISCFHVFMTPAHTVIAQACLGILLNLDENITTGSLRDFPLARYAAEHWVEHALFENVSSSVEDGIKRLFDPSESHLSTWVWIYDPEYPTLDHSFEGPPPEARATPLHYAISCGMPDVATFLIVEHSQDVNAREIPFGQTPLHTASRHGDVELAQVLLEHGAEIDALDNEGKTSICLASEIGHVELVQFLLKQGADAEAQDDVIDRSPLETAVLYGCMEVARVLLEHGVDANAQNKRGHTPLFMASEWGNPAAARLLLSYGADVKARCKDNQTLLHVAIGEEITRLLLELGVDANALDIKNRTPLHCASDRHVEVVQVLLEHGVDANARDVNNVTPLHVASGAFCWGYSDLSGEPRATARLLLQYGSDIHARDDQGQTPFMIATARRYNNVMQLLLEHGAEDHRLS
jgi:ankyrin repeat protein